MFFNVSNAQFLTALFGDDAPFVHVSDFAYDPSNIPKERHLAAWAGNYFSRYNMGTQTNQYFTISCFYADDEGKARRRKALYRHTNVIVLDDVKEKLDMSEVSRLPQPSWILETSPGSEQWGYILDTPCADRSRVENLLDGLVANGLAPDGRDPGMKGVTRYVRLPEGINNKANKLVNGKPFNCTMQLWAPDRRVTMEQLAKPFAVDLNAARREGRVDGASAIPDHPLLNVDAVLVKEVRSDGRFDITCPWVEEHTGADDSGAAIFTNEDGSMGFKCHHGACQVRTGRHLLDFCEQQQPGFGAEFSRWKAIRSLSAILGDAAPQPAVPQPAAPAVPAVPTVDFMEPVSDPITPTVDFMEPVSDPIAPTVDFMSLTQMEPAATVTPTTEPPAPSAPVAPTAPAGTTVGDEAGLQMMLDALRRLHPTSTEALEVSATVLKHSDSMSELKKMGWHDQVRDLMGWSKQDLTRIIKDLRNEWYTESTKNKEIFEQLVFVRELNQFYNPTTRKFMSVDGFQNSYADEDAEARKTALQNGATRKVDALDYAPGKPSVFSDGHCTYGNIWSPSVVEGTEGSAKPWLDHFENIGWGEHRKHVLQWMAYTILHPEHKINHMLLMGSREGCGKDFLIYPLMAAMGQNGKTIEGSELLEPYNGYLIGTKYLHVNETELGNHREAQAISNKLKPVCAAPPDMLRVRELYTKPFEVRNVVNGIMTTNSQLPLRLKGVSRRYYAMWSDLMTRDADSLEMSKEWKKFWQEHWDWMKNGGINHCIWYLRNCVDLSDFNPGEAPPVTDFMRDIQDQSKGAVEQTIEAFINARQGFFASDLLTTKDISDYLKFGELYAPELMMETKADAFTPVRVGHVLREMNGVMQRRAVRHGQQHKVWVLRDLHKYQNMGPAKLFDAYYDQHADRKRDTRKSEDNPEGDIVPIARAK